MPTIAVRAVSVDAHLGRLVDHQLGGPDEPGQPALGVPRPAEAEIGRVLPGEVLGVAHEAGRPEPAVRARLVEPDAVRRLPGRAAVVEDAGRVAGLHGVVSRSRLSRLIEPGRIVRCRLAIEPDAARSLGVEDDDRGREGLVLVGGMGPRVVELVQDVGVDPPRAPLAVDRLGGAGGLDGDVVRVDLGPDPVEQDPPLAADGGPGDESRPAADESLGELLDDRAAELGADLLAALGDLERCGEDRLAPSALGTFGGGGRPEQAREHAPARTPASSTSPFITARARIRWSWVASASRRRGRGSTSGSAWIPA